MRVSSLADGEAGDVIDDASKALEAEAAPAKKRFSLEPRKPRAAAPAGGRSRRPRPCPRRRRDRLGRSRCERQTTEVLLILRTFRVSVLRCDGLDAFPLSPTKGALGNVERRCPSGAEKPEAAAARAAIIAAAADKASEGDGARTGRSMIACAG